MTDEICEFLVLAEAEADYRTATTLADRIFIERGPDWLGDILQYLRKWSGFEPETAFSRWTEIKRKSKYGRSLGHFTDGPRKADAAIARVAILSAMRIMKERPVQALILIRDLDSQPERRQGFEQARHGVDRKILEIVIGTSDPKREAWVMNGFVPLDEREKKLLEEIRRAISFDPCLKAERLRGTHPNDSRNIKKVLNRLTNGKYDREEQCWSETDLNLLINRGEKTGLTSYLNEVEAKLLSILTRD